jgi:hypothetical protein
MNRRAPPWIILSGGSEAVSLAVAEAAWREDIPYVVVALGKDSLLSGARGSIETVSLWRQQQTPASAQALLLETLVRLRAAAGAALPVLPTEDDGLLLLNGLGSALAGVAEFSRCRPLRMGGLDKAELFEFLERAGLSDVIAPTLVLDDPSEFDRAVDAFGPSVVFKPAHKPWCGSVGPRGIKVVTQQHPGQSMQQLRRTLEASWHLAHRWVAQQRLAALDGGERSACVVAAESAVRGCEVIEKLKYPRAGGSAVWVSTTRSRDLLPIAERIAAATGLVGMAEMSFLADPQGRPRLLELNTRPWLQVALVEASGYPIIRDSVRAFSMMPTVDDTDPQVVERDWLQLERLALSVLHGDGGSRLRTLRDVVRGIRWPPVLAVYSTRLPGMRWRWLRRMATRICRTQ